MRYGLALTLIAILAVVPACAKRSTTVQGTNGSTTIQGANGPVTVSQDQGSKSITFQSNEGTSKIGVGAVDPASLGLPLYPGALPNPNGSLSSSTKAGTSSLLTMETADSFDKVYAFYKDKMPAGSEKSHVSAGGNQMASFQVGASGDKVQKTVNITTSGDKTDIMLMVGAKQ
jgi:hypothetical protein